MFVHCLLGWHNRAQELNDLADRLVPGFNAEGLVTLLGCEPVRVEPYVSRASFGSAEQERKYISFASFALTARTRPSLAPTALERDMYLTLGTHCFDVLALAEEKLSLRETLEDLSRQFGPLTDAVYDALQREIHLHPDSDRE